MVFKYDCLSYKLYLTVLCYAVFKFCRASVDDFTCPPEKKPVITYLINTQSCQIKDYNIKFNETGCQTSCGERKVTVTKISDRFIMFHTGVPNSCCYKFVDMTYRKGREDSEINYSDCIPFIDGTITELASEVIYVDCGYAYSDVFDLVKKKKFKGFTKKYHWNVIVLGIDNMSRARARAVFPSTTDHIEHSDWLDFKGYNKIGLNTYPNIMSLIFNKNISYIEKICRNNSDACNKMTIWHEYRKKNYMTAFGEDSVRNSMFKKFRPFKASPTHHFMKPLFLAGESRRNGATCTKQLHSGDHILDYTIDFTKSYSDRNFFGFFWISSYSYDQPTPKHADEKLLNFIENFEASNVSKNTFLFLLSDHGINYGGEREHIESYYDSRLPMLYVWVPHKFKKSNPKIFENLKLNRNRLITPYDLHMTLRELPFIGGRHDACPLCNSLFSQLSPNRRCIDVSIDNKWCSCHNLKTHPDSEDRFSYGSISYQFIRDFNNRSRRIETKPCTRCVKLYLGRFLRSHKYTYLDKVHYVVAFTVGPGNLTFEATLEEEGIQHNIINAVEPLYKYSDYGYCVKRHDDAKYCICSTDQRCKNKLYRRNKRLYSY